MVRGEWKNKCCGTNRKRHGKCEGEGEGKAIDMEMGCVSEGGSQRFKTELNLT